MARNQVAYPFLSSFRARKLLWHKNKSRPERTPLKTRWLIWVRACAARQEDCWGCSARFCLISLTLSTRSSACLSRLARSSADSTISALRR